MKSFGRCIAGLVVAAGLLVAAQAGAVTAVDQDAPATAADARETVVNSVITSIDAKQGILVAGGHTYHFDPKAVSFSDDRQNPPGGGLASLKAGSKVTLRTTVQDGTQRLLQIIARN